MRAYFEPGWTVNLWTLKCWVKVSEHCWPVSGWPAGVFDHIRACFTWKTIPPAPPASQTAPATITSSLWTWNRCTLVNSIVYLCKLLRFMLFFMPAVSYLTVCKTNSNEAFLCKYNSNFSKGFLICCFSFHLSFGFFFHLVSQFMFFFVHEWMPRESFN